MTSRRQLKAEAGSFLFLIVAPGLVAGLIPWWITGWELNRSPAWVRATGIALIILGVVALLFSFVRFVVEGSGTPAPVAPTEELVVGGLYRYVRNPMYVAVTIIIVGQGLPLAQLSLVLYALIAGSTMAAFARFYEEPTLGRRFGDSYDTYRENVPGWWPRLTPWDP